MFVTFITFMVFMWLCDYSSGKNAVRKYQEDELLKLKFEQAEIRQKKRDEWEKSPEGLAAKAKWKSDQEIEMLMYLANDPDLSKFKAKCRARGEIF